MSYHSDPFGPIWPCTTMSYFLENVAQIVIKKCGRIVRREAIRFIAERNRLARECLRPGKPSKDAVEDILVGRNFF
jgi:hypothetical protein